MVYTASKAMDVQTIDHTIIIIFIVLGNIAFFISTRREKKEQLSS